MPLTRTCSGTGKAADSRHPPTIASTSPSRRHPHDPARQAPRGGRRPAYRARAIGAMATRGPVATGVRTASGMRAGIGAACQGRRTPCPRRYSPSIGCGAAAVRSPRPSGPDGSDHVASQCSLASADDEALTVVWRRDDVCVSGMCLAAGRPRGVALPHDSDRRLDRIAPRRRAGAHRRGLRSRRPRPRRGHDRRRDQDAPPVARRGGAGRGADRHRGEPGAGAAAEGRGARGARPRAALALHRAAAAQQGPRRAAPPRRAALARLGPARRRDRAACRTPRGRERRFRARTATLLP